MLKALTTVTKTKTSPLKKSHKRDLSTYNSSALQIPEEVEMIFGKTLNDMYKS